MSVNERYLAFATPPIISSNEFTTEYLKYEPAASSSTKVYGPGDSISISLSNMNKAQFLVPDACSFCFEVLVEVTPLPTTAAPGEKADNTKPVASIDDIPRLLFGCPFFESSNVSVPGSQSYNAAPSSASGTAAYWHSTRLLASSVSPAGSPHDRALTLAGPGRYAYAGLKSGLQRCDATVGNLRKADDSLFNLRGSTVDYALPLSMFCTLFCKPSALIPAGYLSTGGESLVFQWTVTRSLDDVVGAGWLNSIGIAGLNLRIINPRIELSVCRVQSPAIVSSLSNLYDGRMTIQVPTPARSAPVSVPVQMVIAHKRYVFSSTTIPKAPSKIVGSSSFLNLTFSSVNEPSVSAVVIRMRWKADQTQASITRRQKAGMYLGSDEPLVLLKRLQLNIGDQQIPLQGISDIGNTSVDISGTGAGTFLQSKSGAGLAAQLFDLGRRDLEVFMTDDHSSSLSEVVYDPMLLTKNDGTTSAATASLSESVHPVYADKTPIAIFVIPLTSFPRLCGDFSDAHTIRSFDMRSVSSFSVTANVQEIDSARSAPATYLVDASAPYTSDIIVDGALLCDGMLRLGAGSSDSRYIFSAVQSATVAPAV